MTERDHENSNNLPNPPANAPAPPPSGSRRLLWFVVATGVVAAIAVFVVAGLLISIYEHKQEAKNPFFRVVTLDDNTVDPSIWGKNFPQQYDTYRRTVDMVRTRFGGSEARPRVPDDADPRSIVAQSRLEEDPRLKTMWAGYAFAVDFREERGHAYMLSDQTYTQRQRVTQQPGTCVHCHASTYVAYKELGDGDIFKGFEKLNHMPYQEARQHVEHPVACIDCHDPQTMQLRVTRPAFIEGIKRAKAAEGIENYDVNTMATRQEMRSFVCGQCHVEYYFKGEEKRLTYPWFKGLKADEALAYYDEVGFSDWTHAITKAPMLKAQHPEFEMWNQGTHARAGVACADCHMPYMRVGAMKVSDHWVRSPLLNINHACQTCHRASEEELRERAYTIQSKTYDMRNMVMDALVSLIEDIADAMAAGATDDQLKAARQHHRRGQFFLDYIEAENSMGFHADQEAARILNLALDEIRQGQIALRGLPTTRPAGG
ncbi:MAG TPA: ammonia-forming cytochrome c nitrite reductase subunit c552 [Phycisphaerae bacterium]|nr:ammonia-forming cytochrome c nitrite reductase subunit c552 [Phycisphaerae bacterium]HOJ73065.1 ammonia-forming cytochrome c nitrite reductase subunit c552 [Phycisphaerae bacterium]HPU27458.1 ammonia-forming cytochrome c nitrite reductase subunit c552 [Phycisphaerae bacterium]HPZ97440.1 ammonia-forming cytochrome c nitrite reductase subunit c552 [Phycisphaerae bacterium]